MEPIILAQGVSIEALLTQVREIIRAEISQARPAAPADERLLSPKEAAALFYPKISLTTLHSWTTKGYVQAHYLGGRKFYRQSEILAATKTLTRFKKGGANGQ